MDVSDKQLQNDTSVQDGNSSGGSDDVRESPAFRGVISQLEQERARAAEMQAKLDQLTSAQEQAQKEAEEKRLADEGRYKEIADKARAETEQLRAAHAAELRKRDLTTELIRAGLTNDIAIAGAIATCPGDADVSQYVAEIREKNPNLFVSGEMPPATTPAQGRSAGASDQWANIKRIYEEENKSTPEARAKWIDAARKISNYLNQNGGSLPWESKG